MTIHRMLVCDPESVVLSDGNTPLIFAFVYESIGRDPHEYTKSKSGAKSAGHGAKSIGLVHAPLHRRDRKVLAVKEFFENAELMQKYSRKISQFVSGPDDIVKVPFADAIKDIVAACHQNGGKLVTQCVDLDLRAIWCSDKYYGTNLFPNGPYFKAAPIVKDWNSIKFVCARRWFTSPRLNTKMLRKYPDLIDLSLEGLVMTIRKDLSFHQSHRPQDDVDLLIEVLDHVYTAGVSKQDFWDLLQMNHDYYDNKPVTARSIFSPGSTRPCTVEVSHQDSSKN